MFGLWLLNCNEIHTFMGYVIIQSIVTSYRYASVWDEIRPGVNYLYLEVQKKGLVWANNNDC